MLCVFIEESLSGPFLYCNIQKWLRVLLVGHELLDKGLCVSICVRVSVRVLFFLKVHIRVCVCVLCSALKNHSQEQQAPFHSWIKCLLGNSVPSFLHTSTHFSIPPPLRLPLTVVLIEGALSCNRGNLSTMFPPKRHAVENTAVHLIGAL